MWSNDDEWCSISNIMLFDIRKSVGATVEEGRYLKEGRKRKMSCEVEYFSFQRLLLVDFWISELASIDKNRSTNRSVPLNQLPSSKKRTISARGEFGRKRYGSERTLGTSAASSGALPIRKGQTVVLKRDRLQQSGFDCFRDDLPRNICVNGSLKGLSQLPTNCLESQDLSCSQLQKSTTASSTARPHAMNVLAHCEPYIPSEHAKISSSHSAFSLSAKRDCDNRSDLQQIQQPQPSTSNSVDWFVAVHSTPPSLRTFKPKKLSGDSLESCQETGQKLNGLNLHTNAITKPALKPKPVALRREKSDLCASSVGGRVARYVENSTSNYMPFRCTGQIDITAAKSYLEGLKRKREDSLLTSNLSESSSRLEDSTSMQPLNKEPPKIASFIRTRNFGVYGEQHRLSVPNLAELIHNGASTDSCGGIHSSVKALTSKLGRTPGTGELQTINEGLITPVIRRKQYNKDPANVVASTSGWMDGDSVKPFFHKSSSREVDDDSETGAVVDHAFTRRYSL
uniref:HECT-type E3 ubiquitin transferase n=1 Tax=Syphacia muris TaxID=451379 RepID=A0A0N5ADU4_9BILA